MESLTITKLNNSKRTSSSRRLSISTKPLVSNVNFFLFLNINIIIKKSLLKLN